MFVMSTSPSIVLRQRYTRVCTHCVPFFTVTVSIITLSINILIYLHGSIVSRIDHGFISLSCRTKQRLHRKIISISVTNLKHLEIHWRGCKHRIMRMITAVTTYIKAQLIKTIHLLVFVKQEKYPKTVIWNLFESQNSFLVLREIFRTFIYVLA